MTKEYRIEAGNRETGHVGFLLYTKAESPEAALAWAKQEIGCNSYIQNVDDSKTGEPLNLYVYFNTDALTLANVWDFKTDTCCAPPEATAEEKMLAALVMIDEDEEDLIHGRTPRHGFSAIKMARQLALAARKGQS